MQKGCYNVRGGRRRGWKIGGGQRSITFKEK